jgi:uncharacterized membrane protein YfcA
VSIPPIWLPVLVGSGWLAGFVNTIAGGGSFFSYPLLVLLGFPPHLANGTIRVTIVLQNLVGVPTFAREGHFYPRQTLLCSLAMVPAGLAGSLAATRLDAERYGVVSAVLVLVVLVTLFVQPSRWQRREPLARIRWKAALPLFAGVGFYGGFFQLGVGMPFLATAVLVGGWDLVRANSVKVACVLLVGIVALAVFASSGNVDWSAGLALGAGNMVGAWHGARAAVRKGPGWIRWVMVAMALLAAARLLWPAG